MGGAVVSRTKHVWTAQSTFRPLQVCSSSEKASQAGSVNKKILTTIVVRDKHVGRVPMTSENVLRIRVPNAKIDLEDPCTQGWRFETSSSFRLVYLLRPAWPTMRVLKRKWSYTLEVLMGHGRKVSRDQGLRRKLYVLDP